MHTAPIDCSLVWPIRHRVMYPDDTPESVKLPLDHQATHWAMWEGDTPISVISVFESEGEWQFRKFATELNWQRKGVGTKLLNFVMQKAEEAGVKRIWCNARLSALPFYEKFGMKPVGDTWKAKGFEYIKMEKLMQ